MRQGSTVLLKPHHLAAFPLHQVEKKRRSRAFKVGTPTFKKKYLDKWKVNESDTSIYDSL